MLRTSCLLLLAVVVPACGGGGGGSGSSGGGNGGGGGNQVPAVALTSPSPGATFTEPATIELEANASDPEGSISRVDFFQGAVTIGTAANAPFKATWTGVPAGTYSLRAVAIDGGGLSTSSNPVAVTVLPAGGGGGGNTPPTVTLSSPAPDSLFLAPASIPLLALAADADGSVTQVQFFQGGTLIGTAASAPFQFTWSGVPAGTYSLTAIATDDGGATTVSLPVTVTVMTAGWEQVASGTTESLNGVFFTDASNGWVVGNSGTILRSTDGGTSWSAQSSGTTQDLSRVTFADVLHGWIVGKGGTLLATTDGGESWFPQSADTTVHLNDVSFVDSQTGWLVGDDSHVFKTLNGGATWTPTSPGIGDSFLRLKFVDAQNGWLLGTFALREADGSFIDNRNVILHTTDGGATWSEQRRTQFHNERYTSLDFLSPTLGWVAEVGGMPSLNSGILMTMDGGATWTVQTYDSSNGTIALDFVSPSEGWGVGTAGIIVHTDNGGADWAIQRPSSLAEAWLLDVHFVNSSLGWAVGESGRILRTTNGGRGGS